MSTTTTTATTTHAPIVCAPWCSAGDGHSSDHRDDQRCESEPESLTRSLASQWYDGLGGWHPTVTQVFVRRGPKFPLAVVLYECGEQDYEVALRPAEARALAAHLVAAAEIAEVAR